MRRSVSDAELTLCGAFKRDSAAFVLEAASRPGVGLL